MNLGRNAQGGTRTQWLRAGGGGEHSCERENCSCVSSTDQRNETSNEAPESPLGVTTSLYCMACDEGCTVTTTSAVRRGGGGK